MELTAQESWRRILSSAQDVLPEQSYRTWLESAEAISLAEDKLVVAVQTQFAVEWVEDKYGPLLHQIAEQEMGDGFRLRFEPRGTDERIDFPDIRHPLPGERPPLAPQVSSASAADSPSALPVEATLNERYTFDRFVIGRSNEMAGAAANRVADAPANDYNPLFIWGGTGLGKTHLMHAIGNALHERQPEARIAYLASEQFTNEMIDAIKTGETARFRERYRRIDLLLVDDVHFFAGKEGTQDEFFNTFNELYHARKQIVITSDRPPQEIPGLHERLVSRFEWGLVADVQPPDLETRSAILRQKADEDGTRIGDDVIEYVARCRRTSVRQLEGALIKLLAYSSLTRREISVEMARDALGPEQPEPEVILPQVSPQELLSKAAALWEVPVEALASKSRKLSIIIPRQVAMYLLKTHLKLSYTDIGHLLERNHSTVIHSVTKIETKIASDFNLRARVQQLERDLYA